MFTFGVVSLGVDFFPPAFFFGYLLMSRMFVREYRPVTDMGAAYVLYMIGALFPGMRLGIYSSISRLLPCESPKFQIWKAAAPVMVRSLGFPLWLYSWKPGSLSCGLLTVLIVVALAAFSHSRRKFFQPRNDWSPDRPSVGGYFHGARRFFRATHRSS